MNPHDDDPLAPARGIMLGCLIGTTLWALLGALLYVAARAIQ